MLLGVKVQINNGRFNRYLNHLAEGLGRTTPLENLSTHNYAE
jgi:hypothetical protein